MSKVRSEVGNRKKRLLTFKKCDAKKKIRLAAQKGKD
jgi:hypothetical protein